MMIFSCLANNKIRAGVPNWQGFANPNGEGIYLALLREVYGEEQLTLTVASYHETLKAFRRGELDVILGVYADDLPNNHLPNWHLDYEKPLLAFYNSKQHTINHVRDLEPLTLAWVEGYGFEKYTIAQPNLVEVRNRRDGIARLLAGEVDVYVGYDYFQALNLPKTIATHQVMQARPLYASFINNDKGKLLARMFDRKMAALAQTQTLQAIYGEHYANARFDLVDRAEIAVMFTDDTDILATVGAQLSKDHVGVYAITQLLTDQLSQYQLTHKKLAGLDKNLANEKNAIACVNNAIATPQRQAQYAISDPVYLYQSVKLYSTQPITLTQPFSLIHLFEKYPQLTLGAPQGRNYGQSLNSALSKISPRNLVRDAAFEDSLTLKQLAKGRFDLMLETPGDIETYWQKLGNQAAKLYQYQILEAPDRVLGRIICNPTPQGKAFVKAINNALQQLSRQGAFYNAQYDLMSPIEKGVFHATYQGVFITNERAL